MAWPAKLCALRSVKINRHEVAGYRTRAGPDFYDPTGWRASLVGRIRSGPLAQSSTLPPWINVQLEAIGCPPSLFLFGPTFSMTCRNAGNWSVSRILERLAAPAA